MTLDDRPTHPADHAYVLKFRLDSAPERGIWTGRIEHLDSGRRHDFNSREDLLRWLAEDCGRPIPSRLLPDVSVTGR